MKPRRTPFALAAAALSFGFLAACSDDPEPTTTAPAEQVTPPPANAPMDTPPASSTVPTPPSVESTPPAGSSTLPGADGATGTSPGTSGG